MAKPSLCLSLIHIWLDLVNDRVIQLSYIKVYPDGKEERVNMLLNPEKPIPAFVTQLTGISDRCV